MKGKSKNLFYVLFQQEAYSEFAAFFYNPHGGKEIAVIWKPDISIERDFKVNEMNGCALSSENSSKVFVKKEILIEDLKFILKDMYLRIGTVDEVLTASRSTLPTISEKTNTTSTEHFQHKKGEKRYFSNSQAEGSIIEVVTKKLKKLSKDMEKNVKKNVLKNKSAKSLKINGLATKSKINKKGKTKILKTKKSLISVVATSKKH